MDKIFPSEVLSTNSEKMFLYFGIFLYSVTSSECVLCHCILTNWDAGFLLKYKKTEYVVHM